MAKKKSVGRIVAVQLIRTFLIVTAMIITGIISYKLTLTYYNVIETDNEGDGVLDIVGDVTADGISRNIIYAVDSETRRVTGIVIEILNMASGNLDYMTIPVTTRVELSADLYKRICDSGIDAPQIMNMEGINDYYEEGPSYEYGILIIEDYLGIDIGYYTCMEQQVFDECFVKSDDSDMYKLNDVLVQAALKSAAEDDIDSFIKSWCERFKSDLKVKNRLKYSDSYASVKPELIYYYLFPGAYDNGLYIADIASGKSLYSSILTGQTHTQPQNNVPLISSAGLNIKVLNGSGKTGVAKLTKDMLIADGFNVVGIGDNPQIVDNTVIYVSEPGQGIDIQTYFQGATIEVVEQEEGVDILIVVGTTDAERMV